MPFGHCTTFRICWRTSSPHLRKISQVSSLLRKKHKRTLLMEFVEPLSVYLFAMVIALAMHALRLPFQGVVEL